MGIKRNIQRQKMKIFMIVISISIFGQVSSGISIATNPIKLILDNKDITSSAEPKLENDRTLVPVRFISEEIGGKVIWNNEDRTVKIEKDNKTVVLKINSHLVRYEDGQERYFLSDIAPIIKGETTYVPLRLVSNALGIEVNWDESSKTINMDSGGKSDFTPIYEDEILALEDGQTINGKIDLQLKVSKDNLKNAFEIRYLLLDPITVKGDIIARGKYIEDKYIWIPKIKDNGKKILVAAIYDSKENLIGGDSIGVNLNLKPKVSLKGVEDGGLIDENIELGTNANFLASYVKYEIVNLDKNKTTITSELDPEGSYNWGPFVEDRGNYTFKVIAYDENNKEYHSETINSKVDISRKLSLGGIKKDMVIDKPVTLSTIRNFNVSETEYILRDPITGNEESLKKFGYGNYKWFPGPEYSGTKEILVRIKDTSGRTHDSNSVAVKLQGNPKLIIEGIGPEQVITSEVKIKSNSNVKLNKVDYLMINPSNGREEILGSKGNPLDEITFEPREKDSGYRNIKAIGLYNGKKIESEEIPIRIYLDKTYGPEPIIEKHDFLNLASELAKESWEETGMSAALQTAQAILETGWGQSVPVDKYTGQTSNNLFGIKGEGPAGSVISNTWEEYNGTTFRIDAKFRAYNNINESWENHKELLLKAERYGIFRDVMHNSTQGAWALRRAGYATDSQYPIKLMNIIKQYDLESLDKVEI